MIFVFLGGIGFFLLGMILMTEGLQAAAGNALRQLLVRFTRGPLSSLTTGVAFTAIVQSSSITTLATIGFVSAGLLTFTQSIGVIFGANLGTTVTSWLVALVGLKVNLDTFALPLIGVGALIRLLGKGRKRHFGEILAGFGLLFVGIEYLQMAMADLGDTLAIERFLAPGILGRLTLVLFGVVMTVVMQSSSAAVATTLTALSAGTISLDQAAAVVIGQNVGTTVKALLGAISATTPARRTAAAHIVFNLTTGVIAFAILPVFIFTIDRAVEAFGDLDDATTLAAFHSVFNLVGVLIFLPFMDRFAGWIERLIPDRTLNLTWRLQDQHSTGPEVRVEAAHRTLSDLGLAVAGDLQEAFGSAEGVQKLEGQLPVLFRSQEETWSYLATIHGFDEDSISRRRQLSTVHACDHLGRLLRHLESLESLQALSRDTELSRIREQVTRALALVVSMLEAQENGESLESISAFAQSLQQVSLALAATRKELRASWLEAVAQQKLSSDVLSRRLVALLWSDALVYHAWRFAHHLLPSDEAATEVEADRS